MAIEAEQISVDLPNGERILMLHRPKTRDRQTIEDIWVHHPYRLARYIDFSRRHFIDESYRRIVDAGGRPLIVDCGANIGASVLAFRFYYPEAEVVAVEPEPVNFAMLKANVGNDPKVRCVRAAVASTDGEVRLTDPGRSTDAYRTGVSAQGREIGRIAAYSMGTLIDLLPGATPLLAKIDIEGGEAELFSADTDWVDMFPAIAIELHDWMLPGQASSAAFLRCVGERGRDFLHPPRDIAFSLRNPD